MTLQSSRIIAFFALYAETYLIGIVPLYFLIKWHTRKQGATSAADSELTSLSSNAIIQILLQFGGGVLFATVFTHLIPELNEHFEAYKSSNDSIFKSEDGDEGSGPEVPYIEITICLGFFLIFIIEELMHHFLHKFIGHENGGEVCYNRDLMDRCSSIDSACNPEYKPQALPGYVNPELDTCTDSGVRISCIIQMGYTDGKSMPRTTPHIQKSDTEGTGRPGNTLIIQFLRGFAIIFAFSVHSVFDGLAIGLQGTVRDVWSMFFAISVHKLVIAFVVSIQLYEQSRRMLVVAIHMAIFAVMSPIGILIVIVSQDTVLGEDSETDPVVILLTAIAAGTLLYIVFYEILQKERCQRISGFVQFMAILVGFGIMLTNNILLAD